MADETRHGRPEGVWGGRLVAADGRELPFGGAEIEARAGDGIAEITLRHLFVNDGHASLEATYQTPLPAEAAVGAYSLVLGGKRMNGRIVPRHRARERYEHAIAEGRTAALLDEEHELFTQRIGAIPPGAEVICELRLDHRLDWTGDGWEWRFPTVIAPRRAIASRRAERTGDSEIHVLNAAPPARVSLELQIAGSLGEPHSPTHPITSEPIDGRWLARLADENGARLNRDLVVGWPAASPEASLQIRAATSRTSGPSTETSYGLLTLTPPPAESPPPRDVVLLLDTSGSMSGRPLEQARRLALELLDHLRPSDRLEMIRFGSRLNHWRPDPTPCDARMLEAARDWITALDGHGATDLRPALEAATQPLDGERPRHVVLLTDGHVTLEPDFLELWQSRSSINVRVDPIGIGPAPNRTLLSSIARLRGGHELYLDLEADAATIAEQWARAAHGPHFTHAEASGEALPAPVRLPDLAGGTPRVVALPLRPGGGPLEVRAVGPGGVWREKGAVERAEVCPELARRIFARALAEGLGLADAGSGEFDRHLERIGLEHRIATRQTSWLIEAHEPTADPQEQGHAVKIPQELPAGLTTAVLEPRNGLAPRVVASRATPARMAGGLSGKRSRD